MTENDRTTDDLIAHLSHRLRTPLGAMSNSTAVLRHYLEAQSEQPTFVLAAMEVLERQLAELRGIFAEALDGAAPRSGLSERPVAPAGEVDDDASGSSPSATTTPRSSGVREVNQARRVVIVEDDADNREMLALLLGQLGLEVVEAATGEDGVAAITGRGPALALVDIGLPDFSGYEVARRVRAKSAEVRLVALTGYGSARDVEEASAAGFDLHVTKPIDPHDLMRLVGDLP